ncbi:MAG: oligoribonuclease [Cycloclasticus sp.]|nr:oligoribonuclease [Cycloclasticus sp.]MBG95557.1 oligoribonuclease [Cycloclasticus sp.]HAI96939.1 oligoribonuclease [Methylococcaceae bacterium]
MSQDKQNLIWIDLEMTGLEPATDSIIEIATVVTDKELNVLAEGPVLAVNQAKATMDAMDDWNQKHHGQSGLIDRVLESPFTEKEVEQQTITFLEQWVPKGASPMCGNSICQDRRFLANHMPALEDFFHYRNLDVSTLKELASRWAPALMQGFKKKATHQALEDVIESIEELKYYREHFIHLP